jgi:hypothetical protein
MYTALKATYEVILGYVGNQSRCNNCRVSGLVVLCEYACVLKAFS